ncbi:DUF4393 domain-containing protein [Alteromonas sp. RKMC-009]|uniref:DUF4393 domain-containing protein n=1 Tax=Alteromonas sp. RKMC-009 TaxID=2267264 RepID=UPI000E6904CC|nr:DUF4393 domain-containing protein [Alteromonas sp. RKMC-009]AYA65824.1 DUF4393 domain-containing protein [Alteromonas sp. RKMC-009]
MTDKEESNNVEGTINAVTGLVKEVPIYNDAIQPFAKEVGKSLETVGKTVNLALAPIRAMIWGADRIEEFVNTKVAKRLEQVPIENIQTPDPSVAGPALESLKYNGHKETLADLYANLIASAMDKSSSKLAHPGFVEIIRNLSSDEAKIFNFLSTANVQPICNISSSVQNSNGRNIVAELVSHIGVDSKVQHNDLMPSYLTNLERLGLIDIPRETYLTQKDSYKRLEEDPSVRALLNQINAENQALGITGKIDKFIVKVTSFGKLFGQACVKKPNKPL